LSPVDSAKVFSRDFSNISCLGQASRNKRVSSAYCTMGNSAPLLLAKAKTKYLYVKQS
jgi:hypothetical protein